jgi:acyl-CoA thioesterase
MPEVLYMSALANIRDRFRGDRYATDVTGAEIVSAECGHAVCSLALRPDHLNANGAVMGGAIFTLADFAFAVAANGCENDGRVTVSLHNEISFLSPAKGKTLIAEARRLKAGHKTSLYLVDIRDELGTAVAHMSVNGYSESK